MHVTERALRGLFPLKLKKKERKKKKRKEKKRKEKKKKVFVKNEETKNDIRCLLLILLVIRVLLVQPSLGSLLQITLALAALREQTKPVKERVRRRQRTAGKEKGQLDPRIRDGGEDPGGRANQGKRSRILVGATGTGSGGLNHETKERNVRWETRMALGRHHLASKDLK